MFQLVRESIKTPEIAARLQTPEDGALVTFEGVVRNHARGKRVLFLEYEAYESMAVKKMEEIGSEALARWPIRRIGIVHRLGRLEIGECSVLIVVTSDHRQAAFEACKFAIDTLKQQVPIWKKEYYADGELWIEGAA